MNNLVTQALDKTQVGMIIIDKDLKVLLWNEWMQRFTGISSQQIIGKYLHDVYPRFKTKLYSDILSNVLYYGQSRFCSSALHEAIFLPQDVDDESIVKQNLYINPIFENGLTYALIEVNDVTTTYDRVYKLRNLIKELEVEVQEIKTTEQKTRHQAMHDHLTGLPNRIYFNDRLAWAIKFAERNQDKLAVLFLDLDGFKEINDTFGHAVGDKILQKVAERAKNCVRSIDTIARLGGDEFTGVLIQLKSKQDASIVAKKLIDVISKPYLIDDNEINLSVSIGISTYPHDGNDPTTLLKKADKAMYKVKYEGKNSYGYNDDIR